MKPVHAIFAFVAVIAGLAMYLHPRYGTLEAFIGILIFAVGVNFLLNRIRHRGHNSK
jgi:hypothetical protein